MLLSLEPLLRARVINLCIVDDGSTDATFMLIDRWRNSGDWAQNVRIIRCGTNMGLGRARQRGIDETSGDWIWFLDADDRVTLSAESIVRLRASSCDVVKFGFVRDEPVESAQSFHRNNPKFAREARRSRVSVDSLICGPLCVPRFFFARAFVINGNIQFPNLRRFEDLIFLWRVQTQRPTVQQSDDVAYAVSGYSESSITGNPTLDWVQLIDALRSILASSSSEEVDTFFWPCVPDHVIYGLLGCSSLLARARYLVQVSSMFSRHWQRRQARVALGQLIARGANGLGWRLRLRETWARAQPRWRH